ncbi:glucan biosynthesis protein G [Ketogulonicigenium robustum]|uniref:Glucan biosynthesis protein G n=1 Tax=Ketogulonicigenium robustum TaxID=92947 RepID=A0A1W6NWN0_9RHOB|nr:glucan biosynthesis protein G [Ketogulonicigenium robustum]ARO13609.1 glucan biosynthesis protein G [Ketogulonicigenium robustum]
MLPLAQGTWAQVAPGDLPDGPVPFSYDRLSDEMKTLSQQPYTAERVTDSFLTGLDYDDYRSIAFRPERARGTADAAPFRLQAFHMGWLFTEPVRLFEISGNQARPMIFSSDDFDYRGDLAARVPAHFDLPGVAGFRLHYALNRPDIMDELIAFLGASYFRALGRGNTYGASARGLAVNTGATSGEEFPRFSRFYIDRGTDPSRIVVYAAMESDSLTGAYRFEIVPGRNTTIGVTARLFLRKDISVLGVAPLTSMFLYSEKNRAAFDDYRPNVHDSDGLKVLRAGGDILWRPLNNPARLAGSFLSEESPIGFGLMQRDRDFANYQDAEAHYEERPSIMVRPRGDWGKGFVRLLEIPTDLETNDNIVAFWVPEAPAKAGDSLEFNYDLIWGALPENDEAELAHVFETRAGHGGVSGTPHDGATRKFVVDFRGGIIAQLPADDENLAPVVDVNGGTISHMHHEKLPNTNDWRIVVDIAPSGDGPVEISGHFAGYDRKLSEVWIYQWVRA